MKKQYILLTAMFGLVLLFGIMVSAAQSSLGTFKQNDCVELIQTCADCTFNNITSLAYPNSTVEFSDAEMTKSGSVYTFQYCNTTVLGTYTVNGIGDPGGTNEIWIYDFKITYNGKELSQSSSTIYIVFFALLFFLFFAAVYGINKLPNKNHVDQDGVIMKISYLKYVRSVLWFALWMLLVGLFFITSNLGFAYLEDTLVPKFLFALYQISFLLTLPMIIIWFLFILSQIFDDKKIRRLWERGMYSQRL